MFYVTDGDGCICDSDPRLNVNTGSDLFYYDSVPVAAELFVYDSPVRVFPKPFDSISNPDYCHIIDVKVARALLNAAFSEVKMVRSMFWDNVSRDGFANIGGRNIIIKQAAPSNVWLHELGHNLGLEHRDNWVYNLMNANSPSNGWEVNRVERIAFER